MKEKLKGLFTRNIWTKILSVLIAALVWVIIMSISDPVTTITIKDIPVERRNEEVVLEENLTYEVMTGDKITIKVSGVRSKVEDLSASDFVAYVDFTEIGYNAVQIHVEPRDEAYQDSVSIVSQSSENMGISIVETETESFAVEVVAEDVEDGFYAVCTSVSSKLLYVSGAKSLVDQVDHLEAWVSLSGRTESYKTNVELTAVDSEGNVIEDDTLSIPQKQIQVEMTVLPTKEVPLYVSTEQVTTAEGFGIAAVEYSPKSVVLAAEAEVLSGIDSLTVDFTGEELMKDTEGEIELAEFLPEGVYPANDVKTVYVSVVVELLKSREFVVSTNSLELRDLSSDLKASILQPTVDITVYGLESAVSNLTAETLGLYVDLKEIDSAGNFSCEILSDDGLTMDPVSVGINIIRINNPTGAQEN